MPDDLITQMAGDPDFAKMPLAEQKKALTAHDPSFGQMGDADLTRFVQAHQRFKVPSEKEAFANPPVAPTNNLLDLIQRQQQGVQEKSPLVSPTALQGVSPSEPGMSQMLTRPPMNRGELEQSQMARTQAFKEGGPNAAAMLATVAAPEGAPLWLRMASAGGAGATAGAPFGAQNAAEEGGKQAGYEAGGAALSYAGSKIAPAAIRAFSKAIGSGKLDEAGQAIDQYLSSGTLSKVRVKLSTQIDSILDSQIDRARKIGAESLAKRLEDLQATWAKNYNLNNMSLSEANQFKRDLGKFTSFAGEPNKITLNQVQRMVGGYVKETIEGAAPGVKELNRTYENLNLMQQAMKQSGKKLTTGYTGAVTGGASEFLKTAGSVAPNILRSILGLQPVVKGEQ